MGKMDQLSGIVDAGTRVCLTDMFHHDVLNNAEMLSEFNDCVVEGMMGVDRVVAQESVASSKNASSSKPSFVFKGPCSGASFDLVTVETDQAKIKFRGKLIKVEWME